MEYFDQQELYISIPDKLKVALLQDFNRVARLNMVILVLVLFIDWSTTKITFHWWYPRGILPGKFGRWRWCCYVIFYADIRNLRSEFSEGIKLYFEKAIENLLLYPQERPLHEDLVKTHPDTLYAEVYGIEHLLRLLSIFWVSIHSVAKMPIMLAYSEIGEEERLALREHLTDFMRYLTLVSG